MLKKDTSDQPAFRFVSLHDCDHDKNRTFIFQQHLEHEYSGFSAGNICSILLYQIVTVGIGQNLVRPNLELLKKITDLGDAF